jgi:hypothetical protein
VPLSLLSLAAAEGCCVAGPSCTRDLHHAQALDSRGAQGSSVLSSPVPTGSADSPSRVGPACTRIAARCAQCLSSRAGRGCGVHALRARCYDTPG